MSALTSLLHEKSLQCGRAECLRNSQKEQLETVGLADAEEDPAKAPYFSTRKCRVGPRGVRASLRFVLPIEERENRRRCETPRGPAIVA